MPVWEKLATDQFNKQSLGVNTCLGKNLPRISFDPWQVVPRQAFTPYSRLLISTAFVVVSCVCFSRGNRCGFKDSSSC